MWETRDSGEMLFTIIYTQQIGKQMALCCLRARQNNDGWFTVKSRVQCSKVFKFADWTSREHTSRVNRYRSVLRYNNKNNDDNNIVVKQLFITIFKSSKMATRWYVIRSGVSREHNIKYSYKLCMTNNKAKMQKLDSLKVKIRLEN